VDLEKQLLPGTFERTMDYLAGKLDLGEFDLSYTNDELRAKAYPPEVLLKIILYCY
jgi:hypothetical protein